MKYPALLAVPVLLLTACAGAQNHYSGISLGLIEDAVDCAAEEVGEEGFTVTRSDREAGLLRAERGIDWVQVEVVPADQRYFEVNVESADTDAARDAAQEVVEECATRA